MKIVKVEWVDIHGTGNWFTKDEAAAYEPAPCVTVGFLVHQDKKKLVISQSAAFDGQVGAIEAIPTGCIKSIKYARGWK